MPTLVDDPEVATVAIASLTKMVSLLAAELVVGMHQDDINLIESCMRAKLFANVEGIGAEQTAAGVALAQRLIEPVLRDLRARVEARVAAETASEARRGEPGTAAVISRRLH